MLQVTVSVPFAVACDLSDVTLPNVAVLTSAIRSTDCVLLLIPAVAVITVVCAFVLLNFAVATPLLSVTADTGVKLPLPLSLLQLTVTPGTAWRLASSTVADRLTVSLPATTDAVLSATSVSIAALVTSAVNDRAWDVTLAALNDAFTV